MNDPFLLLGRLEKGGGLVDLGNRLKEPVIF